MQSTKPVLVEYFVKSQFHGLRFLGQEGRHWTERLFWLGCICASWYGCYLLMMATWQSFQTNAIGFATETTYLGWNTSLMSVTVCEDTNLDRVFDVAEELYGYGHDYNLDEVLKEITFFKGTSYYIKEFCFNGELEDCPQNGFKEITEKFRSPCNETFLTCTWMDQQFDCCKYFVKLETELGPCFSANSMQTSEEIPFPFISNQKTGLGSLKFEFLVPASVFIHGPEDVPTMNTIATEVVQVEPGSYKRRIYGVTEIVNQPEVREVGVEQRRCRFPEENYLTAYSYYSYTACVVECRAKAQLRLCNCTSHLTPRTRVEDMCDLQGLQCLNLNFANYSVIINEWTQRPGLVCSCLPGCSEPEFELVEHEEFGISRTSASVEITLGALATLRYKRNVVRGRLDLVVSMGGIAGLFVGASLLSFVELFYFFTVRCYARNRNAQSPKLKNNPNVLDTSLGKLMKKRYKGTTTHIQQPFAFHM